MGAASRLAPGDEGYDPDRGETEISSSLDDGALPRVDGHRTYDEMSDQECERLASIQGWKPLAVYHGPPGGFVGAREFLKRADEQVPILRAQNRRMTEKLAKLETEVGGLRSTVSEQSTMLTEIRAYARNANEEGYRRARAELEQRQDEAAANADQVGVREARERIRALDEGRREATKPETEPRTEPPRPQLAEEIKRAWEAVKAREPWAGRDPVLTTALIESDKVLQADYPDMPVEERFNLAVAQVKKTFPQFFPSIRAPGEEPEEPEVTTRPPAQPTRAQSRPSAPGQRRPQTVDPNTIASIEDADDRAQAKLAFERYKRQMPDFTEAEYMAIWRNPKIDARQQRQEAKKRG